MGNVKQIAHNSHLRRRGQINPLRNVTGREIAMCLVLQLANIRLNKFSLIGYYEDDAGFLDSVAKKLGCESGIAYGTPAYKKVERVVRKLVRYDVFYGIAVSTPTDVTGEPEEHMEYGFRDPNVQKLLRAQTAKHAVDREWSAAFLLRHAYPDPDL